LFITKNMNLSDTSDREFIQKLTEITLSHLDDEKFGVEELILESGLSKNILRHRLKIISKHTINQFIHEVRLQKAFEMLFHGGANVSEVSWKVGFGSPEYFIRCFHDYYGYPPGEVKKRATKGDEVDLYSDNSSRTPSTDGNSGRTMHRKTKGKKVVFGLVGLLVIISFGFFIYTISTSQPPNQKIKNRGKSIAILPFRNDSGDPENAQFTNGTMEAILDILCKVKDLRVIPRTSVEQYRNSTKTIPQIARELNVSHILEGSGQKFGDDIKLSVQLIDASQNKQIWSCPYEKRFLDIFNIQSEIAGKIVAELKALITPAEKLRMNEAPTENLAAYEVYLKANDFYEDFIKSRDPSSYQTSVNLYNTAFALDSNFAKAFTGLAKLYHAKNYWALYFDQDFLDSMMVLCDKAISIDKNLDEAYYLKGYYYWKNGNNEEALVNLEKVLEINPNHDGAYSLKGYIFTWHLFDFVKGIDNYHKALALIHGKERPALLMNLGRAYLDVGFKDKAIKCYQEALTLNVDSGLYYNLLSWVEFSCENLEESVKMARRTYETDSTLFTDLIIYSLLPENQEESYFQANRLKRRYQELNAVNLKQTHRIGYAYAQVGKNREAREYYDKQIKISEECAKLNRDISQRKAAQSALSQVYAITGNKTKAYHYLDILNTMNFYPLWRISILKYDPMYKSIRSEERFQKILQNMEAKHAAEHERVKKWLEKNDML
jgi:TolB-like protein/AraC-like DNA-binding protein/Flp pilus assembly protein TadD